MNDFEDFLWIVIVAVIVVHIAFGIISARVASGKGRSPDLGFLAGFLLNVLGLILVMLMRPSVEVEARRRIEVEQEYERQRKFGEAWAGHEDDTVAIQSHSGGELMILPVVVLSTRGERERGLSLLADTPSINVLYVWPQTSARERRFLNPSTSLEVSIATIADDGEVEELHRLRPRGLLKTTPSNAIIAVRHGRFVDLQVEVGDRVLIPEKIRRDAR